MFSGKVVPNRRNGTRFGYPTANMMISDKEVDGLFVGYTSLISAENKKIEELFSGKMPSLVFIGKAQTVGEVDHRLESHILDFPEIDLYGCELSVEIAEKLRDNLVFTSEAELVSQMKKDEVDARKWFNK